MSFEQIEIFNSDGSRIGIRDRKDVHSLGLWHCGVHGFIFDYTGRLLIQKRSEYCDTFPNVHDCSVSEHLSIGETFKDAFIRGCHEELGLSIIHSELLVSYRMAYGPKDNMICDLYSVKIDHSEVNFNKAEVASIDFLDIDSLSTMVIQSPSKFTPWFWQQLLWYLKKPHELIVT